MGALSAARERKRQRKGRIAAYPDLVDASNAKIQYDVFCNPLSDCYNDNNSDNAIARERQHKGRIAAYPDLVDANNAKVQYAVFCNPLSNCYNDNSNDNAITCIT